MGTRPSATANVHLRRASPESRSLGTDSPQQLSDLMRIKASQNEAARSIIGT